MIMILETPESTVAVVMLRHAEDGGLEARYAEGRELVPAPRRLVARALRELAGVLDQQATDIEAAATGAGGPQ